MFNTTNLIIALKCVLTGIIFFLCILSKYSFDNLPPALTTSAETRILQLIACISTLDIVLFLILRSDIITNKNDKEEC